MTTYDKKTDRWTAVHDRYTNMHVSGLTRERGRTSWDQE